MITDDLEQYDFVDDGYFEEAVALYSSLVGSFMMNFSYLDHELNIAIADIINDRLSGLVRTHVYSRLLLVRYLAIYLG